jgi:lipopolysaccharide/colanic/teichoic acid biosynthesis glycosyltransferase
MTLATYERVKRVVDVAAAVFGLIVLSPLLAIVAVAVALDLGRPVLFKQARAGLHGKPFTVLKFRTMLDVDPRRALVTDAERLTWFGRFLRSTSLDELPSLWNVLCGDMSLVGPRPLPAEYLARYTDAQRRRHDVQPGITGLAQVKGRNSLSWEAKFQYDVAYVDNRSLALDVRIMFETARTVVARTGISADGQATAPEFLGTGRLERSTVRENVEVEV